LTSWNVFSHHFFGFFELLPLTSWMSPPETSFLIIFSDFLNFDLLKRLFSSFFRIFWIWVLHLLKRLFSSFFRIFWTLTSWNVFSHHFLGFFELGFSTSWNDFSHHFFGFFELWPLTSWNVFSHNFFGFF
jgi:hypothetical protein